VATESGSTYIGGIVLLAVLEGAVAVFEVRACAPATNARVRVAANFMMSLECVVKIFAVSRGVTIT